MNEPDDIARSTPLATAEPTAEAAAPPALSPSVDVVAEAKVAEGDAPPEAAEVEGEASPPVLATSPIEGAPTGPEATEPTRPSAVVDAPGAGPYRTPPRDELVGFGAPKRTPWPVFGPALSGFGVMLWTFVVAGQFTTSWSAGRPLDQGVAVVAVGMATLVAWALGLRSSRAAVPSTTGWFFGRAVGVIVSTLVLFVMAIVGTTAAAGFSSRNHDFLVGFLLVAVAYVSVIVGARLTAPEPRERTHGQRFVQVALWVASGLLSFVAGADLASNG
jgi:hypothetical protein